MKASWVILLLSSLLFSCKKEASEKERVGQFITDLIHSVIDDHIYSKKRAEIVAAHKISYEKINLLLVVKDFYIKDIRWEKCDEYVEDGNTHQVDCYIVAVYFTQSRYIDFDGKLKENEENFLGKDSTMKFEVKKVDDTFQLLYESYLAHILSEMGEKKLVEYKQEWKKK